ncbi:MAG: thioredoxin [Patescibacteria group bacterium]|nr:thioredoxin [Patescibacteria group bacterium]
MIFNKDNFKTEVEGFAGLVLVDFFAPWCGPCQMMSPLIDELIAENKDKDIKIGKLDIDESPEIAIQYGIMGVPTFIVFKNGKAVDKKTNYCDKEELKQLIAKNK